MTSSVKAHFIEPISKLPVAARSFETGSIILFLMLMVFALSGEQVIGVLNDFESGGGIRGDSRADIKIELSNKTEYGNSCLQVSIPAGFNWRWKGWRGNQDLALGQVLLMTLSCPYLPPEADAVRMKVKLASGRAIITVGGPVNQIGNSDVYCDPQLLDSAETKGWQTIELSLNHRLIRNYRRPNFTVDLPVIYYSRWAQEPFFLYLMSLPDNLRSSDETVLYVDQIELIARGEGKPFPKFDESVVKKLGMIIDFDSEQDIDRVFSVGHGYSMVKPFEFGYRRQATAESRPLPDHIRNSSPFVQEEGTHYPAPRYRFIEGEGGGRALEMECFWAEEGQIATVKTTADAEANAFRMSVKPNYRLMQPIYGFDFESKPAHVVDLIVFVSPDGDDFPWDDIAASEELKKAFEKSGYDGPGGKYDYLLTTKRNNCVRVSDIRQAGSFGFYFARRYVAAGEWSTITVPFADFVCVYGQGDCADMQRRQQMLSAENIAAVGVTAPYGSNHGTLGVDNLRYVKVPGTPSELRSFWQVPDLSQAKLIKLRFNQYGGLVLMGIGEDAPEYLK